MKWITVNYPSASLQKYQLVDNNATKVVLKYNPLQQSVRISSDEKQRLFFIEKTGGIWNNKFVFKNEYGVVIGRFTFDKSYNHAGHVEMDGQKYHYSIRNSPVPELLIYEHDVAFPLVHCDLITIAKEPLTHNRAADEEYEACLLLGLGWYYFLSGSSKAVAMEYSNVSAI